MKLLRQWKAFIGIIILLIYLLAFYLFSIDPTIYSIWSTAYVHTSPIPLPIILTIEISILTFVIGVSIYYNIEQYKLSMRGFTDLGFDISALSIFIDGLCHKRDEFEFSLKKHISNLLEHILTALSEEIEETKSVKSLFKNKKRHHTCTENTTSYLLGKLKKGIAKIELCGIEKVEAAQLITRYEGIFRHVNTIRSYNIAKQPMFLYYMELFLAFVVYVQCIPLFLALYAWIAGIIAIILVLIILVVVIDGPMTINPIFSKETFSYSICEKTVNDYKNTMKTHKISMFSEERIGLTIDKFDV